MLDVECWKNSLTSLINSAKNDPIKLISVINDWKQRLILDSVHELCFGNPIHIEICTNF